MKNTRRIDTRWYFEETRKIAEAELAAETARLLALYRIGHIYVIEFTSGVVKVGKALDPKSRSAAHAQFAQIHGGAIRNTWVSRRLVGYGEAERELIQICSRQGDPVSGREYFGFGFRLARSFGTLVEANRFAAADLPSDMQALLTGGAS